MFNSSELQHNVLDANTFGEVEYPLMEDFYTIQGEGAHTGKAAYFIRTAGCDVNCWWCDVKESWDEEEHPKVKVDEIVARAKESGAQIAVITGGEPLLHDLYPLTHRLKEEGLRVHIETSGSSKLSGNLDWITLSPKRFKEPLDEIFPHVDELKIVVLKKKDLEWAEENAAKCPEGTKLLLQPEWDTPSSMDLIVEYVKKNPEWGISLQTHKFLGVR
ncbi:7-carboxy-7-deazaguanine synthase QueE [Aliifodinibius sp. S!AR15-10]|uniref:7-carboxy-7-deazaguanine synthase QueE n=1 Tax=Aliifodinibius sp. S!AR15-10 TaxID=2950437 RepID=UPI00286560CC|nr:7-carboxy-7-deazaguanine synthase QueE [Aliifodinibius sp. S!AR15-10]MDR8391790.1 7-carboxy-7-deazaguanine synthase QueE [Aliifodinibius sp. S!AR15-10]